MSKADIIVVESEKAFLAERMRTERLNAKTDKYVGAIVVIIGFHLIDLNRMKMPVQAKELVYICFAVGSLATLGLAMGLALLSLRVKDYLAYPVGTMLIDQLKDDSLTEEGAKIRIAGMYLRAHDVNSRINDGRARLLSYSSILIVLGFGLAVVTHLVGKYI